ncbi:hypothetical protein P7I89_05995 [Pseudomonas aeruginosa]|nr:hypothetical protein P7I89_05995 [Pseudomonas aeruginosa]
MAAQIHLKLHLRNGPSKMGDQGARIINVPVEFVLQTDQGIRVHLGCLARLPLTVETLPLSIGERVSLARPVDGLAGKASRVWVSRVSLAIFEFPLP